MSRILLALLLLVAAASAARAQKALPDPAAFAESVVRDYTARIPEVTLMIAEALGRAEMDEEFRREFGKLAGRTVALTDRVYDQTYGSSLRQIVFFTPIESFAFVYLRFNFKKAGKDWILVSFTFRGERSELFPEGFGPRMR